jgi:hypothetical protein
MVLLATIQNLCMAFEGELPLCYVVWLRSLAAIALLHLLFARRVTVAVDRAAEPRGEDPAAGVPRLAGLGSQNPPSLRFPNVMR